jgi:serine/threonine protein kinase/WD40 repeat protein
MSEGNPSAASSGTLRAVLDGKGVLAEAEALAVLRQLLNQVRALHAAGETHRAIRPETVFLDGQGTATLAAPEPVVELFGAAADPESCPPELTSARPLRLPAAIEPARQVLAAAGLDLDPRRIDVYQLGTLLCRTLTGQASAAYLRSPKAKAKVPAPLQPLIERTLGYRAEDRFTDCDRLAAALDAPASPEQPTGAWRPPAPGSALDLASGADTPRSNVGGVTRPPEPETPGGPEAGLPFQRLGHYRVVRKIGRGGMGDVYLGYEEPVRRRVAIKVLPAALARDPALVQRFHTEATAAARLAHPHLVPIYFIGQDAGHHFYAMKYVAGESLAQRLKRLGRLDLKEALTILEHCLSGLSAAHAAGLVHRDIKPGNILLEASTGRALVADFGLVKVLGQSMTSSGVIMGTVDYIAPEQARGRPVDGRADLYALGVVAYQMLSGQLPFRADAPAAVLFQHAHNTPRPLREAALEVPGAVAQVVERLMAKSPAERYPSCDEVLADLRRERTLAEGLTAPTGAWDPPWRPMTAPDLGPLPEPPAGWEQGPAGRWQRLRGRVRDWFRAHSPEFVQRLQSTAQQVDGALVEYQRRRDRLARLVEEARPVIDHLLAQAHSHRAAAVDAAVRAQETTEAEAARQAGSEKEEGERRAGELEAEAAEQREHLAQLQLDLDQLGATLQRLRSQRDVLLARLRAAQARQRLYGGVRRPGRRPLVGAALTATVLLAAGLIALWPSGGGPTPDAAGEGELVITPDSPEVTLVVQQGEQILHQLDTGARKQLRLAPGTYDLSLRGGPDNLRLLPERVTVVPGGSVPVKVDWKVGRVRQFEGHSANVTCVAFTPDGRRAFSGSDDRKVRVWDALTGKELHLLEGHTAGVLSLAVSPDGRRVLSGGRDKKILVWDADTGQKLRALENVTDPCWGLTVLDGRRALCCAEANGVRLYDVETGQVLQHFGGHWCNAVAASLDRRLFVTGGSRGSVLLWDMDNPQAGPRHLEGHHGFIRAVALTPDGRIAVAGSGIQFMDAARQPVPNNDSTVRCWEVAGGEEVAAFTGHAHTVAGVALTSDGRRILSGSADGTLRLWDVKGKRELARFPAHPAVRGVALSPDGRFALSSGSDNLVRLWRLPDPAAE